MALVLTVTAPFADLSKGDQITDPIRISEVLASDQACNVVQVTAPDAPAPLRQMPPPAQSDPKD